MVKNDCKKLSCCKTFVRIIVRDFYCLNCFHSYRVENKPKKHYNVWKTHNYRYVDMPEEDNKILKYNHGEKSIKYPFIIYAEL